MANYTRIFWRMSNIPIVTAIGAFFTGGNALVRAGVIVLFFGVEFLLRYMAEHTTFPLKFASPASP